MSAMPRLRNAHLFRSDPVRGDHCAICGAWMYDLDNPANDCPGPVSEFDEYGIDYGDEIEEGYLTFEEARGQVKGLREHYQRNGWDTSSIEPGTIVRRRVIASAWEECAAEGRVAS